MRLLQQGFRSPGCAAVVLASLALAGCFTSERPLITAADADYPFESLTYMRTDGGEEITLERAADGYAPTSEGETADRLLLKAMGEDLYVAQTAAPNSDGSRYLYGLIRVAPDRKAFVVAAGMAEDADLEAVRGGVPGLRICEQDDDTICIDSLEAYLAYARETETGDETPHTILNIR